tara:strand:+ start:5353 stop:5517 length:165 start_codon:yes stop_codon:yes gene_type:complete
VLTLLTLKLLKKVTGFHVLSTMEKILISYFEKMSLDIVSVAAASGSARKIFMNI